MKSFVFLNCIIFVLFYLHTYAQCQVLQ